MTEIEKNVLTYLAKTGQTKQELMAGSQYYGATYILSRILPRALEENKKIVWKDDYAHGIGAMSFALEDL